MTSWLSLLIFVNSLSGTTLQGGHVGGQYRKNAIKNRV